LPATATATGRCTTARFLFYHRLARSSSQLGGRHVDEARGTAAIVPILSSSQSLRRRFSEEGAREVGQAPGCRQAGRQVGASIAFLIFPSAPHRELCSGHFSLGGFIFWMVSMWFKSQITKTMLEVPKFFDWLNILYCITYSGQRSSDNLQNYL